MVPDKSLIQTIVKPHISRYHGDAIRAKCLHGESWTNHRGWLQVQVHVLSEGREPVVQKGGQSPLAAMACPAHIMGQVRAIRVHLHGGYKHIIMI